MSNVVRIGDMGLGVALEALVTECKHEYDLAVTLFSLPLTLN